MPEGPELHLMTQFVCSIARHHTFGGAIKKSEVSTANPDVEWMCDDYNMDAVSRGKEMKILLTDKKRSENKLSILFHFGMTGKFEFTSVNELPKHAHLQFYMIDKKEVLSFVDSRRFGRWFINAEWGDNRGPCIITEYLLFRQHVLNNLEKSAFGHPICEAMLDQKFFNGVGNYLRAEVLYRLGIRPFDNARTVLTPLLEKSEIMKNEKDKENEEDILYMTHVLSKEVVALGFDGGGYFSDSKNGKKSGFGEWLQCYYKPGMKTMKDSKGRTMWFHGDPGKQTKVSSPRKGREKKILENVSSSKKVKKEKKDEDYEQGFEICSKKIKKETVKDEENKKEDYEHGRNQNVEAHDKDLRRSGRTK